MKLFEFIKDKNYTKFKILGISLYSKFTDKIKEIRKTSILFGLFYIKDNLRTFNSEIRLLGIRIISAETSSLIKKYLINLPSISIFKTNITEQVVKELEDYIPDNIDAFYFGMRSGEFFLLMYHFLEIIKKYNTSTDRIIVLTPYKYHISILSLFFPEIPIILVPFKYAQLNRNVKKHVFNLSCKKRLIIPVMFSHYLQLETKIKNNENAHFYEYLKYNHHLAGKKLNTPKVNAQIVATVETKIKRMNLNVHNFVILSLNSVSNEPLEKEFITHLIEKISNSQIDIYFNSLKNDEFTQYGKTCYMTHAETFYLAQKARAVIGLRSGFMDTIAESSPKTIALYTAFKNRPILGAISSKDVLRGFSLKQLPNVNPQNIHEYDVEKYTKEALIANIMEIL